jgi:hypothetical protein
MALTYATMDYEKLAAAYGKQKIEILPFVKTLL